MTLDEYLSRQGAPSMAAFARSLGLNADQVRQWRHGHEDRRPSPENCALIEAATCGQVTCEELQPELRWMRVPDAKWLWHRRGRPVLNVGADIRAHKAVGA